jgi:hypothetical protein
MSPREEVARFADQIHGMRALRKAAVETIRVARQGGARYRRSNMLT